MVGNERFCACEFIFLTISNLVDIYAHGKNVQKSTGYMAMVHRAPNTLTLIDKKAHGRRRRIISQGFGDSSLRKYQPTIIERVQGLCATVDRHCGDGNWSLPMNMADYCKVSLITLP